MDCSVAYLVEVWLEREVQDVYMPLFGGVKRRRELRWGRRRKLSKRKGWWV